MWILIYRKALSIQKGFEYISINRVFSQEYITFGNEAGIELEWGRHEVKLMHTNGQLQGELLRSLCGATTANIALILCIHADLI